MNDLNYLEKLSYQLARSRWKKFAMMRTRTQAAAIETAIQGLLRSVAVERVAALSPSEGGDWLRRLRTIEKNMADVETAIPFERKLKPGMRSFAHTFQRLMRIRHAARCGVAALQMRLEPAPVRSTDNLGLSVAALLDSRDAMLRAAAGWQEEEMAIYEQL